MLSGGMDDEQVGLTSVGMPEGVESNKLSKTIFLVKNSSLTAAGPRQCYLCN